MAVLEIQSIVVLVVLLVLLVVKGFAFVNAVSFPAEAYDATGKQTKQTWTAILGIGLLIQLATLFINLGFLTSILNLGFTIAAFVYLADVRPALKGVMRGRC